MGAPRIKMIREDGKPDRCQIRVDDVLVFDGISMDALVAPAPAEPPPPNHAPPLEPYTSTLEFLVNGVPMEFYITQIQYTSGEIRFEAQDAASLTASNRFSVSGN